MAQRTCCGIVGSMSSIGACVAVLACADTDPSGSNAAARDSAGIAVITSDSPQWSAGDAWHVDSVPLLTIGRDDGPPEYQLYRVRGAVRLDDGTIAIADGGSHQIRFYDVNGGFIRSVGREGEGPGEYRVISRLARFAGDSLLVWDFELRRFTILGSDGSLARVTAGPRFDAPYYYIHAVLHDGTAIGSIDKGVTRETAQPGVQRLNAQYFLFQPDGRVENIAQLFTGESYVELGQGMTVSSIPFARNGLVAAGRDRIVYGNSSSYELHELDRSGNVVRIVRNATHEPAPVTDELIDSYIERATAGVRNDPARQREMAERMRRIPRVEAVPAFDQLIIDADGNVWVRDYMVTRDAVPVWRIFDAQGRMLGEIRTPRGFTISDIGTDYLLGQQRDEMDVERIVMYRLTRPQQ